MEEKARGGVRINSEISHPHTLENVGTWTRGRKVRDRFCGVQSKEANLQVMCVVVVDPGKVKARLVAVSKGAHTRGSRWPSLASKLH